MSTEATNEEIFWIIVTAYVGRALGLLDPATEAKLNQLFQDRPRTWSEQVESALEIDGSFVRSIYALCSERNTPAASIGFLLRGLGCPSGTVDARIRELAVKS